MFPCVHVCTNTCIRIFMYTCIHVYNIRSHFGRPLAAVRLMPNDSGVGEHHEKSYGGCRQTCVQGCAEVGGRRRERREELRRERRWLRGCVEVAGRRRERRELRHHWLWHLASKSALLSPKAGCCMVDEDYVGQIKHIVASSVTGSTTMKASRTASGRHMPNPVLRRRWKSNKRLPTTTMSSGTTT